MNLFELPPDEISQQERGFALNAMVGAAFAVGIACFGRSDLYAYDDHVFTVRLFLGPMIVEFTKLDRSKYDPVGAHEVVS